MSTGSQIRKYRKMLKWTLERLSEASGVETGTISALENRNSQRSEKFPSIAKAFGLTVEQLCDETTEYTPKPPSVVYGKTITNHAINARAFGSETPLDWPFSARVAPWQYAQLSDQDKTEVENFILFKLQAKDPPAEQTPPANIERTGTYD